MKKAVSCIFGIVLLLILMPVVFSGVAYAADPNVRVSPSSIVPFQQVTFNVSNCNPNERITLKYRKNGALNAYYFLALLEKADNNGSFTDTSTNFAEEGIYSVMLSCKGEDWSFPDLIQVNKFNGEITLRAGEAVNGEAILTVEGCPPKGEVLIDWKKYDDAGQLLNFGQLKDITDNNGVSESLFRTGTYIVDAACGGKNSENYSFTVLGDNVDDNQLPTLPPPPEPPCEQTLNGKCVKIKTAIGTINTDGAGILYNLFTIILSLSGGILVLTIMYAGYLILTSQGKPEQIQKGRELLTSAIVGFLFIVFSYVILTVITSDILHLPGFGYDVPCVPGSPC